MKIYSCNFCNTTFTKKRGSTGKYCSKSCAAKANNALRPKGHPSRTTPNSKRGKTKSKSPNYTKISWCKICNTLIINSKRVTCSDKCKYVAFQNGGKQSASQQISRSKNEILLYDLCKNYFKSVRHNIPLVDGWDADIIIDDHKIAILWNGVWHYKQMPHKNHSLLQVQTRDRIKINKLSNVGWNVLIFEERSFTPKTAFDSILLRIPDSNTMISSL